MTDCHRQDHYYIQTWCCEKKLPNEMRQAAEKKKAML
jgi:hypothetical protein